MTINIISIICTHSFRYLSERFRIIFSTVLYKKQFLNSNVYIYISQYDDVIAESEVARSFNYNQDSFGLVPFTLNHKDIGVGYNAEMWPVDKVDDSLKLQGCSICISKILDSFSEFELIFIAFKTSIATNFSIFSIMKCNNLLKIRIHFGFKKSIFI